MFFFNNCNSCCCNRQTTCVRCRAESDCCDRDRDKCCHCDCCKAHRDNCNCNCCKRPACCCARPQWTCNCHCRMMMQNGGGCSRCGGKFDGYDGYGRDDNY